MPSTEELLTRNNELLTLIAKSMAQDTIKRELSDKKSRKLYELTGRGIPVASLSKQVGLAAGTISKLWQQWEEAGLLIKDGKSYRRVF